jgi:hypothetical protein
MKDGIRPDARVRVEIPRNLPCPLHCIDSVPVLEAVGTVDRLEAGPGRADEVSAPTLWANSLTPASSRNLSLSADSVFREEIDKEEGPPKRARGNRRKV